MTRSFVLLACLSLPVSAFAQGAPATQSNSSSRQGFGIGAKIGPLFSSISENDTEVDLENRTGWIGGLFMGGNRSGVVGVGVDVLFARKGANVAGSSAKVTTDYINVPVYLRINGGSSNINRGVIGYGIIGVDLNFLLREKLDGFGDVTDEDNFKRADYGIAVGAGVEVSRFIVEGRYTKGLGNIAKGDHDEEELKSSAFSVMFGVRFN